MNDALDALQAAATDDETLRPGLIEVSVDDWIQRLAETQTARPKTIVDGIRIRDIMVAVNGGAITRTLTRSEAGERGQPYRDDRTARGRDVPARSKTIRINPCTRHKVCGQRIRRRPPTCQRRFEHGRISRYGGE